MNSKNSSKPPSSDPNRKKGTRKKSDKPSGRQLLHKGNTLQKVEDPNEIEIISIDHRTLPKEHYTKNGFEIRQIFDIDIDISWVVTEYQAQRLINEQGKCFVAPFPKKVSKGVQYGDGMPITV